MQLHPIEKGDRMFEINDKIKSELQSLNESDDKRKNKTDYQDSSLTGRGVASQLFRLTSGPMNCTSLSLVPSPSSTIST